MTRPVRTPLDFCVNPLSLVAPISALLGAEPRRSPLEIGTGGGNIGPGRIPAQYALPALGWRPFRRLAVAVIRLCFAADFLLAETGLKGRQPCIRWWKMAQLRET